MLNSSRSQKIQSILEARRPMASKAKEIQKQLLTAEAELRSFLNFIPTFAQKTGIDPDIAQQIQDLDPDARGILQQISDENSQLDNLIGRFSRNTLNIGVAGLAGQGKSTLLQSLTGLSSQEIPSGAEGHCTGAPSMIQNHDSDETYAKVAFFTEAEFFEEVIKPFYTGGAEYLGSTPSSLNQFASSTLPSEVPPNISSYATEVEHLKKLRIFKDHLNEYKNLLTGSSLRIPQGEIRAYVSQHSEDGKLYYNWPAVKMATIYCRFPQADIGQVALADTPGLGDFLMGAEEQLVATVGKSLDTIAFLRRPPESRAVVLPADTQLYDLISRSIPSLSVKDWSYYIINKDAHNSKSLGFYQRELEKTKIQTRKIIPTNCFDKTESAACLDEILNDVAGNLSNLDNQLFKRQQEAIKQIAQNIQDFSEKAKNALPHAGIKAHNQQALLKLFNERWKKLTSQLQKLVNSYRENRTQRDEEFISALDEVVENLDKGPQLPSIEEIEAEAAGPGLQVWHGDKLNELRVRISNSFEGLDKYLEASFNKLRGEVVTILKSESGGQLEGLLGSESDEDALTLLSQNWADYENGEAFAHAVDLLIDASLSFRGFIQPRVRECLNVLDSSSSKAASFAYAPGDTYKLVADKLECAWESACYDSEQAIREMAKEPSMARFAAIEDFREAIVRTGGAENAKQNWQLFYGEIRAEVWPTQFEQLEEDTRQRREWENAVKSLQNTAGKL